jgi:hypothetical protein
MAHEEPVGAAAGTGDDVAVHERDYARFTTMFKWGAVICLIIGLIVLMILK